ncbi:MAG: phosphatidylcholine/phosphatidylserine synthase [Anaerolineales bacterium]
MKDKIRIYFPNTLTFLALGSGLVSIIVVIQGYVFEAGIFILIGVILDSFDGYFARKLEVDSQFGIQLDSLSDMVSFGVAPLVLVLQHLTMRGLFSYWIIPGLLLALWAGAYRLARFNLQPTKESIHEETRGITITNSGVILTLAVLSDLSNQYASLAIGSYTTLLLILSYLMISKLKLPSLIWLFPSKRFIFIYLIFGAVLFFFSSFFTSVLIFFLGGLAASISRKLYFLLFQRSQSS